MSKFAARRPEVSRILLCSKLPFLTGGVMAQRVTYQLPMFEPCHPLIFIVNAIPNGDLWIHQMGSRISFSQRRIVSMQFFSCNKIILYVSMHEFDIRKCLHFIFMSWVLTVSTVSCAGALKGQKHLCIIRWFYILMQLFCLPWFQNKT